MKNQLIFHQISQQKIRNRQLESEKRISHQYKLEK